LPFLKDIIDCVGELDIEQITHSDRTIELLLPEKYVQTCVKALHQKYVTEFK